MLVPICYKRNQFVSQKFHNIKSNYEWIKRTMWCLFSGANRRNCAEYSNHNLFISFFLNVLSGCTIIIMWIICASTCSCLYCMYKWRWLCVCLFCAAGGCSSVLNVPVQLFLSVWLKSATWLWLSLCGLTSCRSCAHWECLRLRQKSWRTPLQVRSLWISDVV